MGNFVVRGDDGSQAIVGAAAGTPFVVGGTLIGPPGPIGPQGIAGPNGPVGPIGPQGGVGLTGAAGPQGLQGAQGSQGLTGAQGNDGPAGVGTTVNELRNGQANLTGSGLSALTGLVNGANTTFTVPGGIYAVGTLEVVVNGVFQVLGDAITQTTPASGIFNFVTAPVTGDQIYVSFRKYTGSASTLVYGITAGTNITVDNTDPTHPVINATAAASAPDATASVKGILQLTGDLGGTAASPTVPGLAGKAATVHTHAQSDVTGLVAALAGKAALSHTHAIADIVATGTPSATTYLRGDGSWATPAGGGGTPGGSTTQVQYNNAGAFAGAAGLVWDAANGRVGIGIAAPAEAIDVVGNFRLRDSALSETKGYRFRTTGGNLDMDFSGADAFMSVFSAANYGGAQRNYMRLEAGANVAHAIGQWQFTSAPYLGANATIDGATGAGTFKSTLLSGATSGATTLIAAAVASGTLTLPSATDTLVGKATTDILTNKSIAASTNTITGLGIAALGGITGTPSATTYLRSDGTWATPSAGIQRSVGSISTATTAGATTLTDYVYFVTGTTTLTLPTAVGNFNCYTVKNVGVNTVTIASTSGTIDGSVSITLPVQYTSVDLISDGTNWNVI